MAISDLVRSSEIEESAVEAVVKDFISYTDKGEVFFTNKSFWKLTGERQVLLYLAALSGRKFLELSDPKLGANNKEIGKALRMKQGSVRAYLTTLRQKEFVGTKENNHFITIQGLFELKGETKNDE